MMRMCGPNRFCGLFCGLGMIVAGFLMLAVRMGWVSLEAIRAIPFFPLILIFFGMLMLVSGLVKKIRNKGTGERS